MKTHDLAKALSTLAKILRAQPNVDLNEIDLTAKQPHQKTPSSSKDEALAGLTTLANLSKIEKREWIDLIEKNQLPINVRSRDANRDVIGKLLRHLEQNPESRKQLTEEAKKSTATSPQLSKALSILLTE